MRARRIMFHMMPVVALASTLSALGIAQGIAATNDTAARGDVDEAAETVAVQRERLLQAADDAFDLIEREDAVCEGLDSARELSALASEAAQARRVGGLPEELVSDESSRAMFFQHNILLANALSNECMVLREKTEALARSVAFREPEDSNARPDASGFEVNDGSSTAGAFSATTTEQEAIDPEPEAVTANAEQTIDHASAAPDVCAVANDVPGVQNDGTWYVSYVDAPGTSSAAADGSLTRWKPGYFIAHDWSEAGKRIASMPSVVVVDGMRYALDDVLSVPKYTLWDEVAEWATGGGHISFQTCSQGQYLIVRYAPESSQE